MEECNNFDGAEEGAGFLYRTMLDRDPNKRRVKPVQPHLLQLDFAGLDDSSDDSDFQIPNGNGSDDDDDISSRERSSLESGSSPDSMSEGEDVTAARKLGGEGISMGELIQQVKMQSLFESKAPSEDTGVSSVSSRKVKVIICCVCLGDVSEEEDEIVECDGCGVSVHEGCYGVSESQSVASTASSASTAPWFCDACKAGVTPYCELCPNSGGIYKETDASRWVHLVCALYIPGIAFGDVDKLSTVTLFEMPYSRWGAKECCLCEDSRFSQTGVCIRCDAGMCRTFFHVTCAQKEGLLSQASPDEDIADPFYAYCKQHVDKNGVRMKRRNWLALQSNSKQQPPECTDQKEGLRVQRKLQRHRQKYAAARVKRPPQWVPTIKWPRMLSSSASAVRRLMRKAELLGVNSQVSGGSARDIRKKNYVAAAMSVEFVSYYLNRNLKIKNMKSHLQELISQREKLVGQERVLRVKYDQLSCEVNDLKEVPQKLQKQGQELWRIMSSIAGKPLKTPQIWQATTAARSKTGKESCAKSDSSLIHKCEMCGQTNDQHCLACCDTCQLYYHLGCLEPPLTRMPKKTKLMGWQCSRCVKIDNDANGSDNEVNPNAPMRLREKIKEPAKFTPSGVREKRKRDMCIITKAKRRLGGKTEVAEEEPNSPAVEAEEESEEMPTLKREQPFSALKLEPQDGGGLICVVCVEPGMKTSTIRCDECRQCYHLTCLDPPIKKSPRLRGYAWLCTSCSVNNDDDNDTNTGKSPEEEEETNADTGRKRRRRRNSPSVYGSFSVIAHPSRASRRRGTPSAGGARHDWNQTRLSQKSPPTLESHVTVDSKGACAAVAGGVVEGNRKDSTVGKSSKSKTIVSCTDGEGSLEGKRVSEKAENEEESNESNAVKLSSVRDTSDKTTTQCADVYPRNDADVTVSEIDGEKQQSESSSVCDGKTSPLNGQANESCDVSTRVGLGTTKEDADSGVRKRTNTNTSSTEVTPEKRVGNAHDMSATVEGKVVTPPEKGRAKRLKNLGDIVAKLRTETEKSQQQDSKNSN